MPSFLDSSLCQCQQRFLHQTMANVGHWHHIDSNRELSPVSKILGVEKLCKQQLVLGLGE